jgi:transcriptional regulator with XRE-family HTH domain
MDLVKIGRYIAGKRKELGMTQRQLAEKLGMSDKSVSKWERGVCLPDVSVYSELCGILGISINEFLAGEDLSQEIIVQKSEENIIGVATDSKNRQKFLKTVICGLLIISILAFLIMGVIVYKAHKPRNFIEPFVFDSSELEAIKFAAIPDDIFIYKFTTTDKYKYLKLYYSDSNSDKQEDTGVMEMNFEYDGSPESGEIILIPDYAAGEVKITISAGEFMISSEVPLFEDSTNLKELDKGSSIPLVATDIKYNEKQPLLAFSLDENKISLCDIRDHSSTQTTFSTKSKNMCFFSFEFKK